MADGTLKFDTKVDDTGFVEGVKQMSSKQLKLQADIRKTQVEMEKLEKSMNDMQNTKVPTQEFKDIQAQIDQAEKKLNQYLATEERIKATGGKQSGQSWKNLQYNIEETRNTLNAAKADMEDLKSSGGDFTIGGDTSKLDDMREKYRRLSDQLDVYKAKLQESTTNSTASTSTAKLQEESAAIAESTNKTSTSTEKLATRFNRLKAECSKAASGLKKVGTVAKGVGRAFTTIIGSAGKATRAIIRGCKKMTASLNPLNGIKNLFSGMIGRMMIMSVGFMAFSKALQFVGKEMSNIIRTSPNLSSCLAQIKGNLRTAFQPILEACMPALNALFSALVKVTSALAQFISMLFGKSVKVSQSAAKAQYDQAKALDATAGSAKKAKKELKGLADFDELHNTNSVDNSQGGGSAGGGDGGEIAPDFTTNIEMSDSVSDLVNMLKDAWAKADFTEVGVMVAEKLNNALSNIKWDKIKATCSKIAKSVATFINGFFSVKELWSTIGTTIGEGINTALGFVNTLVSTLNFASIGNSIGLALDTAFRTINWTMLSNTFTTGINGIFSAIDNILQVINFSNIGNTLASLLNQTITDIDWNGIGKTISNCFNSVIDALTSFIKNFNFSEIGKNLGTCINDILKNTKWVDVMTGASDLVKGVFDAIINFIKNINWKNLGTTIGDMLKSIDWVGIAKKAINLLITAVKSLLELIVGLGSSLGKSLLNGIKTALSTFGSWFEKLFSNAWSKVKSVFNGVSTFFSGVWSNIKGCFGNVSSWFQTTFKTAWQAVKNVFSKGGKIFDGIKDGILSGLKAVINAIIGGINKVISLPFNGINKALKKIHDVNILGVKPFSFINTIDVPQIPKLATGTVVPANYGNFLATLGDNKKAPEVVSPLPTMKKAFKEAISEMGGVGGNQNIVVQCVLDGKVIYQSVVKSDKERIKQTGQSAFAY